jgi:hypothetical protein
MKRGGLRKKAAMAVSQTHPWLPAGTVADDRQVARRHIGKTVLRDDGQGVVESERTGGVRDRDGFDAGRIRAAKAGWLAASPGPPWSYCASVKRETADCHC